MGEQALLPPMVSSPIFLHPLPFSFARHTVCRLHRSPNAKSGPSLPFLRHPSLHEEFSWSLLLDFRLRMGWCREKEKGRKWPLFRNIPPVAPRPVAPLLLLTPLPSSLPTQTERWGGSRVGGGYWRAFSIMGQESSPAFRCWTLTDIETFSRIWDTQSSFSLS